MEINDYDLRKLRKIKVRGIPFYIMPRYAHLYHDEFECFTADLFLRYLHRGDVVVDVGAHYGFYSLLAAKKLKGRGEVHAFEPVKKNHKVLKKNIKANKFSNIKTYQSAISDTTGYKTFKVTEASDSAGFYEHPLTKTLKEVEVKTVKLDDYFSKKRVDILKIDTEGNEIKVLEGARKTLKRNKEAKLFIELNPELLKSAGYEPEDLLTLLTDLNFEVFLIDDEQKKLYRITEKIKAWKTFLGERDYANLFCIPKDTALSVFFISHSSVKAGAERFLIELIDGLQERGVLCHTVLPSEGPLEEDLEAMAASCDILPYSWWCAGEKRGAEEIEEETTKNLDAAFKLGELVGKYNPHVVFSNTSVIPWGALAAALARKPHVWMIHEFGGKAYGFIFELPHKAALRMIDLFSNTVFTNSEAVAKHISEVVEKSKVEKVYQFIQIAPEMLKTKEKFFRKRNSLKLVIIGTITEHKGQHEALLAVKKLITKKLNVELLIVGPPAPAAGDYLRKLNQAIKEDNLEERVRILGYQDNPYPAINQADIVLVCSCIEGFGRTTAEAMLLKKPVIGTNSGGTKELIRDGINGFLYEPGNYKELAQKIEVFYQNRDKMAAFGKRGFNFVRKTFSDEKFAGKVYAELLRLKKEKHPLRDYRHFFAAVGVLLKDKELEINKLREEVDRLREEVSKRRVELAGIYTSRSWRLLTFLRRVKRGIPIIKNL